MASDDGGTRPWWRHVDPDLDRAVAVIADQIVDATHARTAGPGSRRGQRPDRGRPAPVDVRSIVVEVACRHGGADDTLDRVEVVGDLRLDTDEETLRDVVGHLVAAALERAGRVHVRLGPRSILVVDEPEGAPPPLRPSTAGSVAAPTGRDVGDLELLRLARRLEATIDVEHGGDGSVRTAVTLPAEALVQVG